MPTTALYTCSRCKKEYNFNNIKYDFDHSLICTYCMEKREQLQKKEELKSERPKEQEPVKYICLSCKFKFSIKKGSAKALKCPYCSKTKLMVVKKYKDEDDLINDSADPKFNY